MKLTPKQEKLIENKLRKLMKKTLNEDVGVKVYLHDGSSYSTSLNPNLSDDEIRAYFKIGMKINVGFGDKDRIKTIKKIEILRN